jgi:hypothetical protein
MRSLVRLEAGAFDHEPDGFARGFVRTVALAIGLDADETVSRMLDEPTFDARTSISRLGKGLLAILVVGVLGATTWVGWAAMTRGEVKAATPASNTPQELPVRRDSVRALAIETGAIASDGSLLPLEPPGPPASDP